ncbi:MAG: intradiol ring-cleavage dioxygenase [Burkholderiaceae bacterium]
MGSTELSNRLRFARRRLLKIAGLAGVPIGATKFSAVQAATQPAINLKTPADVEGPFYPLDWSGDVDEDLLRFANGQPYAKGTRLTLAGQVVMPDGSPASGARVAIWQCDAQGRYRHPRDGGDTPAQEGFQGYGQARTDDQGRYEFATIKPVAYGRRPPHIHFRVEHEVGTLTTQMYFEGESEEKGFFARFSGFASDRSLLIVKPEPIENQPGQGLALQAEFNIYL